MSFLTRLAMSRAVVTALLAVMVMALGGYAVRQLNAELIPEIDFPVVTIVTVYPGAAPDDVAEQVTKPLEAAVSGAAGLRNLQSTSGADVSLIVAEFAYGTDMKKTETTIANGVRDVKLPTGAQQPKVARIDPNSFPVVKLSVSGQDDPAELERLVRERLAPALASVEGVHSVDVSGGADRRVSVVVDPAKAKEKGVSLQQVATLLQANNLALPGGNIPAQGEQVPVRTVHEFGSLAEMENLVVGVTGAALPSGAAAMAADAGGQEMPGTAAGGAATPPAGGILQPGAASAAAGAAQPAGEPQKYQIRPGDSLSALAARFGTTVQAIATANRLRNPDFIVAGETLLIPVAARPSQSGVQAGAPGATAPQPVALKDIAEVRLETANSAIVRTNGQRSVALAVTKTQDANTVKVAQAVRDQAEAIGKELGGKAEVEVIYDGSSSVQRSIDGLLREGTLGALLAVVVVLVFLASLRGALTVAVSIPLSLMMAFLLMWWQGFTLNIMTLGGLAVAIGRVVDDAIVVSESILRRVQAGEPLDAAVRAGTAEVISPVTSSTLTTVAVFLPLGIVSGLAGQVFRPFALTVSFALLASLLCAITVIPALARLLALRPGRSAEREGRLASGYGRALRWALRHRVVTVLLAGLLFLGSLATLPFIPRTLLPSEEEKLLTINVAPPSESGADWLVDRVSKVEAVLKRTSGVVVYQAALGSRDDLSSVVAALEGQDPNAAVFTVRFERDVDLPAKVEELRSALAPLEEGGSIGVSREQSATSSRLRVIVSGDDADAVGRAASEVLDAVKAVPGLTNVTSDLGAAKREFAIAVDPNKALAQGLTTAQVAMQVRQMFAGQAVTRVRFGESEPLEVRLALPEKAVTSLDDLRNLPFGTTNPQPLSAVAEIKEVLRPARITRVDERPGISITGDIVARDTGTVADAVRERIGALSLASGVSVSYGGAISEMEDSFAQMYMALGLAVVLVFAVMGLFFGTFLEPAVILASMPLAAIGALIALFATGRALGLPALIGLLMLIGIVVTNAIVLMDLAKRLCDEGRPMEEALAIAGRTRLRPILMTALATLLALAPLALGFNEGAIIAAELATVVIGGLFSSTLLTLLIVPVVYALLRRPATP